MVTIVKSEWHQVEKRYSAEINEEALKRIYPDKDDDEITQMLLDIESGTADVDTIMGDSFGEIDWDWLDEDDWWTDRKGGYEVTYEVQ